MREPTNDNPLRFELGPEQEECRRKYEENWDEATRRKRMVVKPLPVEILVMATRDLPKWMADLFENLAQDGERFV